MGCGGSKINRPIDRPSLGSVNSAFRKVGRNTEPIRNPIGNDDTRMHNLVDSWKLESNTTAVARLFRRMLESGGKMESGLVRAHFANMDSNYYSNLTSENHSAVYKSVFRKDERYHYIKENALEYLG
jgi:hypothetical protein